MNKRVLILLLAVSMLFILTACGGRDAISGQWLDSANNVYTFDNGAMSITTKDGQSIGATYVLEEVEGATTHPIHYTYFINEVEYNVDGTYTLSEDGTTLTIKDGEGNTTVLKKSE
ncbi:hypothetical protein LJC55_00260 [Eubacteriales bacterium OttesenSCG-928-N14]|nr:hypothetical protein [Eubacteriales bacterium OttesenSCG-928-N14]